MLAYPPSLGTPWTAGCGVLHHLVTTAAGCSFSVLSHHVLSAQLFLDLRFVQLLHLNLCFLLVPPILLVKPTFRFYKCQQGI